ncbi:TIGR02391 family protein [Demequina subtropica]|uniref:TIGR02391 family protein n=1 Tax=Demequina subtropica TaxID=1638989 RepID=UPI00078518DB|nr:TIGR02391 family protein [Demequina subtropica]
MDAEQPFTSEDAPLSLKFDPHTIEHLGSNMYSRLPNAVAELVANAYDADATEISVLVSGKGTEQRIEVSDNGHGMSRRDVRDKYLRIGRNRRGEAPVGMSESGKRVVSGKKGLGKLALFGIGQEIVVSTKRRGDDSALVIALDWDDLIGTTDGDYEPSESRVPAPEDGQGTSVAVSRLARVSDISASDLAESLSRLFHYSGDDVALDVVDRDGTRIPVTKELRVSTVAREFSWTLPEDLPSTASALTSKGIHGTVVAAEKPLPTQMRGVAVYASGRLVNEPEFFGASDSSYAYAYLTGHVTVDLLDEIKPDVVATDRRAVNWDHPHAAEIRAVLKSAVEEIALLRRALRADKKKAQVRDRTGVDTEEWVATVHGPEREPLRDLLGIIESDETDMSDGDRGKAVDSLKGLAPPYADLVWRHLHPAIQGACEDYFKGGDYYQALLEACKQYVADLRVAARMPNEPEASLFGKALGEGGDRLHFTADYQTGSPRISGDTVKNLENGQREMAKAIWAAFRNPLSHELLATIKGLGVISHHDCLDALSLMSHLRRRLDESKFD